MLRVRFSVESCRKKNILPKIIGLKIIMNIGFFSIATRVALAAVLGVCIEVSDY